MEFRKVIEGRRSIRQFLPDPVPREDILDMLRLATQAASASNRQMWRFYVVTDGDKIAAMRDAVVSETARVRSLAGKPAETDPFAVVFAGAPVTIAVACAAYASRTRAILEQAGLDKEEVASRIQRPDIQSVAAAIQILLCAAYEKGYGTCWMSAPMIARPQIEAVLGVPEGEALCALVALGRPDGLPPKTPRRPVEEVTRFID